MNIFKEAKINQSKGLGYRSRRFKVIWRNKKSNWNWMMYEYGIRWSDKWQIFPIWNTSNNCERSLTFGVWKLYFRITYCRKTYFNQNRKFLLRKQLWKFYQLVS